MRSSLLLAFVLALIAPRVADADPKSEAKAHIKAATEAHAAGRFADALEELSLAYSLDPQPELLFAIGQVQSKLGDCGAATMFFQKFAAISKEKEATIARKAIAACKPAEPKPVEPKPDEPKPDEPKPIEPVIAPTPPPPPPPPPPQGRPWTRDWVGHALVGLGVISGGLGVFEYLAARDSRDKADKATSYGGYEGLLDDAHRQRTLGIVFGAGGVVLLGAGILHYALSGKPPASEHLSVAPTQRGSLVTWTTAF